jgi:hypothetical protein
MTYTDEEIAVDDAAERIQKAMDEAECRQRTLAYVLINDLQQLLDSLRKRMRPDASAFRGVGEPFPERPNEP